MNVQLPRGFYSFLEAVGREILKYRDDLSDEDTRRISVKKARGAAIIWLMRRSEDINRLTAAAHVARQYLPEDPHTANRLFDSMLESSDLDISVHNPPKNYICALLKASRDDPAEFAQVLGILCCLPG